MGVAAKNQMVTNMRNTVFGFKRLLGRKFSDPYVQKELKHFPFKVEQRPDDGIGIRVNYLGEDNVFTPEQVKLVMNSLAVLQNLDKLTILDKGQCVIVIYHINIYHFATNNL